MPEASYPSTSQRLLGEATSGQIGRKNTFARRKFSGDRKRNSYPSSTYQSFTQHINIDVKLFDNRRKNSSSQCGGEFTFARSKQSPQQRNYYAFQSCSSLAEIDVSGLTELNGGVFSGCVALKNVTLPDTLTHIGWNVFEYTAFYDDADNWENGALYIDNYLTFWYTSFSGFT